MTKFVLRVILVLSTAALLSACGEKLQLKVKATLDKQPVSLAKVVVDGEEQGLTDKDGNFSKIIRKKPGADVEVTVSTAIPGYVIKPWKGTFLMKLPKSGSMDSYAFDATLDALRTITVAVTDKGAPVADAVVKAQGKEAGKTNAQGEFVYEYKELPKSGLDLTVTKSGYGVWRKTGPVNPASGLKLRSPGGCLSR